MANRIVCLCNLVDANEIIAWLKKGATGTKEIQRHTRAGSSCGRCLTEIDNIVEEYLNKKPEDQQKKLDLG